MNYCDYHEFLMEFSIYSKDTLTVFQSSLPVETFFWVPMEMPTIFQSSLPVKMKMSTSKTKSENQEDVQTILTLKRDAENEDHFEIDLDTIIDPHTGKSKKSSN